jgi:hypothetical protein
MNMHQPVVSGVAISSTRDFNHSCHDFLHPPKMSTGSLKKSPWSKWTTVPPELFLPSVGVRNNRYEGLITRDEITFLPLSAIPSLRPLRPFISTTDLLLLAP